MKRLKIINWWQAGIYLFFAYALPFFVIALFPFDFDNDMVVLRSIIMALFLGGFIYLGIVITGYEPWQYFDFRKSSLRSLTAFSLMAAGFAILAYQLNLFLTFNKLVSQGEVITRIDVFDGTNIFSALYLVSIIITAVSEEFMFRGFLMTNFHKRYSKAVVLVFPAAYFVFFHISINDVRLMVQILFALVLGWIFMTTKSIITTILFHALFEGSFLVINTLHKTFWSVERTQSLDMLWQPLWVNIVGMVLMAIGLCTVVLPRIHLRRQRLLQEDIEAVPMG